MKELNCNLYGLSELTESEKMDTEGGTITLRLLTAGTFWAVGVSYKLLIAFPAYLIGGGILGIL